MPRVMPKWAIPRAAKDTIYVGDHEHHFLGRKQSAASANSPGDVWFAERTTTMASIRRRPGGGDWLDVDDLVQVQPDDVIGDWVVA
jgi:hypothetical protein